MTTHATPRAQQAESPAEKEVLDLQQTTCCVVGGGPGGAVLALLLARKGIAVTLLEPHGDFDRDFRGDTLHPAVMQNMAELVLSDEWPTRIIQTLQAQMQQRVLAPALDPTKAFTPPGFMRFIPQVPLMRTLPARLIGFGVWPVHVRK